LQSKLKTKIRDSWLEFTDIDVDITQNLYQQSGVSHVVGLTLAILLTVSLLWLGLSPFRSYLWLSLVIITYVMRTIETTKYFKNGANPSIEWLNKFRTSTISISMAWSTSSVILFLPSNILNQSIILFTITGLCAGAALTYSIDIISLFGFLFPLILTFILRLIFEGTAEAYVMSSMMILFLMFIFANGRRMHKTLHENIHLAKTHKRGELRERSNSQVMDLIANKAPLKKVLETIVHNLQKHNPNMLCSILLLDAERKRLLHGAAPSLPDFYNQAIHGLAIGHGVGSCGTASHTGKRVVVSDIQTHPYWSEYKDLAARAELAACWSEPILDSNGGVLGTFAIYHHEPTNPSENDIQLILQNAYLAGIAIELARTNQETQLAAMLYQNSNESMMVVDSNNRILSVNPAFVNDTGYSVEEVIGKDPSLLSSGRQDKAFYQAMWHDLNTTGKWQGEIWNRRKNGDIYAEWIRITTIYNTDGSVLNRVSLATDVTLKKESEEIIWKQANFDTLTGLPNRNMFQDRIVQEIKKTHRAKLPLALMFIDLDHFKEINDALGHHMGDLLLKESATRLLSCVRESDTVAKMNLVSRLGGDEFTIVLGELKDTDCVERIAERILARLAEPYQLGPELAYITASIGITMYPEDSTNVETLIKNADQAMYVAKQQGRNRYSYFTESMQVAVQNRLRLTNDLRNAMENQELHLVYQPIVDLKSGKINKAEALIRWLHPTHGLISPNEFIPIAEDTGLIIEIGNWIFQEVVGQVAIWRETINPDFQISINKSPVQFTNAMAKKNNSHLNWVNFLKQLELPGQCIAVEITERLLLDSSDTIRSQLIEFRDYGVQVSLDDFGTGYSSLAYIKKFDIDYIKIDQAFVKNLKVDSDDLALCEAIIVMAHKLNMRVVAEGVETQEQLDLLLKAKCDFGQGYYFSKPVSPDEFQKLLR
jgi:diguanylate cyclase (GGDEF)-like protein/PAS domain S-box-containing protein